MHKGLRVIGLDLVPERLTRAQARGVEVVDLSAVDDPGNAVREMTGGRGADSVIDAVGLEAQGSSVAKVAQSLVGLLPDAIAAPMMERAGVDRGADAAGRRRVRPASSSSPHTGCGSATRRRSTSSSSRRTTGWSR